MTTLIEPNLLEKLVHAHSAALQLFARQWTTTPEDAVQQAFIKLATADPVPGNTAAWLYRVVRNFAISQRRKQIRRANYEEETATQKAYFDANLNHEMDAAELTKAIESLESQTREVVVAKIWGKLNFDEIAELVGCSSSSAHRKYHSGLNELRRLLGLTWLIKK